MRLSDILSKPPVKKYVQIDGFLNNKKGIVGQKVDIKIGKIALNFFCTNCNDLRTFYSKDNLSCIFITETAISIDCVLTCDCGASVPMWFIIEAKCNITGAVPEVRIKKRHVKLSNNVRINTSCYGEFAILLDKAMQAYYDGLGAGAIVYLRKVFEKITIQTANELSIDYKKYEGGNPKNFSELLTKVDEKYPIIPVEFSAEGHRLFKELSNVIHGEYDEDLGLSKFEPLYRLVIGILENVKNHQELMKAKATLGWNELGEKV